MDDFDFELDDIVMFELPTFPDMEAFCDRFRPRWQGWSCLPQQQGAGEHRERDDCDRRPETDAAEMGRDDEPRADTEGDGDERLEAPPR